MAQGTLSKKLSRGPSRVKSAHKGGVGKRKNAPSKKKGTATMLTAAINRNIEAMMVQRAVGAGSGFKIVKQPKQTVVQQRRKALCKTVENRVARKFTGKDEDHVVAMKKEIRDIAKEIQIIKGHNKDVGMDTDSD